MEKFCCDISRRSTVQKYSSSGIIYVEREPDMCTLCTVYTTVVRGRPDCYCGWMATSALFFLWKWSCCPRRVYVAKKFFFQLIELRVDIKLKTFARSIYRFFRHIYPAVSFFIGSCASARWGGATTAAPELFVLGRFPGCLYGLRIANVTIYIERLQRRCLRRHAWDST